MEGKGISLQSGMARYAFLASFIVSAKPLPPYVARDVGEVVLAETMNEA